MTAIIVICGTLAAIILFRWARFLAMLAILGTVAFFVVHFHAWEAGRTSVRPPQS